MFAKPRYLLSFDTFSLNSEWRTDTMFRRVFGCLLLGLCLMCTVLLQTPVALATPPDHYPVVVTRTGFTDDQLCAFPLRIDRPPGQVVYLSDYYDSAGNFVWERERFENFVNILVNLANGKSVTAYATGSHTLYDLTFSDDGSASYRIRTTGVLTRIESLGAVRAGSTVDYFTEYPDGDLTRLTEKLAGLLRSEEICRLLE